MASGINPPVRRIFSDGPERNGADFVAGLYPVCRERRWIPAFFVNENFKDVMENWFYNPLTRTGVIAFGADSAQIYERIVWSGDEY